MTLISMHVIGAIGVVGTIIGLGGRMGWIVAPNLVLF